LLVKIKIFYNYVDSEYLQISQDYIQGTEDQYATYPQPEKVN